MSKGARAMAVAFARPEPTKYKRGGSNSSKIEDLASGMVSMARLVLRVTPTVAQSVIAGEKPLAVAYDEAKVIEAERASGAHRAQADALEIEALAKRRLADEYDAAQERGEVRTRADNQHASSKPEEAVSASDIGLTHKEIHEARQVRDAEDAGEAASARNAAPASCSGIWRRRRAAAPAPINIEARAAGRMTSPAAER
jgi:hypothetical protein